MLLPLAVLGVITAVQAAPQPSPETKKERYVQLAYRLAPGDAWNPGALDKLFDAARPAQNVFLNIPARRLPPPGQAAGRPLAPAAPHFPGAPARPEDELIVPLPAETRPFQVTFRRLLTEPAKVDAYDDAILYHARKHGLDPRLLKAIIAAESEFVASAKSPAGARGLMQLMGATAEEMGVPRHALHDPHRNIEAGAAYLAHLFKRAWRKFKRTAAETFASAPVWLVQRVIAAYNAGPRFLERRPLFDETRQYVQKVQLFHRSRVTQFKRQPLADFGAPRLEAPAGALYN